MSHVESKKLPYVSPCRIQGSRAIIAARQFKLHCPLKIVMVEGPSFIHLQAFEVVKVYCTLVRHLTYSLSLHFEARGGKDSTEFHFYLLSRIKLRFVRHFDCHIYASV